MKKKEYVKPMLEVFEADTDQQLMADSLNSIITTGLDDDLTKDNDDGNIWTDAM